MTEEINGASAAPTFDVLYFLDRLHALRRDHKIPDPEVFIAAVEQADEKTQLILKTFLIELEEEAKRATLSHLPLAGQRLPVS